MRPLLPFSVICLWLFLAAIMAPTTVCGEEIVDTHGNPLQKGLPYHIVPAKSETGRGGTIPLPRDAPNLCPDNVGLSTDPNDPGRWVFFLPNSEETSIQQGDRLEIEFGPGPSRCPYSKMWRTRVGPSAVTYISTGGTSDKPNSRFMIQVEEDAYKIVHPSSDSSDQPDMNVGLLGANSQNLILTEKPLLVKFKPAFEKDHFQKNMLRMFPWCY